MATLYVVATPIGNLEDITLRAIRVLKEVDLIAAEDTRHTRKLLSRYAISTPLTSYHEHNERAMAGRLVAMLEQGRDVALVSDAGTPAISDPGYRLVRLAVSKGVEVRAVPGPSAIMAALSVAALPTDSFLFGGFLPPKPTARRRRLESLASKGPITCVLYESLKRLKATLEDMAELFGEVEVSVARELTKLNEEVLRGSPKGLIESLNRVELKGEITIVLRLPEPAESVEIDHAIEELIREGKTLKETACQLSRLLRVSKNLIYQRALEIKRGLARGGSE